METLVLASSAEGVGRLTFNRPAQRNAMSVEMMELAREHLANMDADPSIRCVVIDGAGAHFMAGGDIKSWGRLLPMSPEERGHDFSERMAKVRPLVALLDKFSKPLIVSVRGFAIGAGLCFVAAADFVVADETARFVFANIRAGLIPDMGLTHFLPRVVGEREALRLSMLGGEIDGAEALRLKLVTELTTSDGHEAAVVALAAKLVALPATAAAETKQLMRQGRTNSLPEQYEAECEALAKCAGTADFLEAVSAFSERRSPKFGSDS